MSPFITFHFFLLLSNLPVQLRTPLSLPLKLPDCLQIFKIINLGVLIRAAFSIRQATLVSAVSDEHHVTARVCLRPRR